ncbi:MAG: hypothetical protein HY884_02430 [Deltaproteobacteria bacterium]|nr:hypothetical protein [Deltaproteobacteria bacterium]
MKEGKGIKDERGCYLFGIKVSKGYRPIYVGKTNKQTFEKEAFACHKFVIYLETVMNRKGTPIIFFVKRVQSGRGKAHESSVSELEKTLIRIAAVKNPELENIHHKHSQKWEITGVMNSGQGKPSVQAAEFKKMLGL